MDPARVVEPTLSEDPHSLDITIWVKLDPIGKQKEYCSKYFPRSVQERARLNLLYATVMSVYLGELVDGIVIFIIVIPSKHSNSIIEIDGPTPWICNFLRFGGNYYQLWESSGDFLTHTEHMYRLEGGWRIDVPIKCNV